MLIDTHCHLEMLKTDLERAEAVRRAEESGVWRMITVGTNPADCERVVAIAQAHRAVFCAVGIHPHAGREATPENLNRLRALLAEPKALALGEIGLDFFKNYQPRDVQIRAFEAQLDLACELKAPVVLHDRDAHEETLAILKARGQGLYRGVFHCFSGDVEFAKQALDLGFYLSFTGAITYKNETRSHEVLKAVPKDRVMIETDSPFLTPMPYRGKRSNEPAYVNLVAAKIAEIWGVSEREVARITTENAYRLFGFETAGRAGEIAYEYKGNLYLNLTNRCSNRCAFCARWPDFTLGRHFLRLAGEPDAETVLREAGDVSGYPEVVFCGYGEPTERLETLLQVAAGLKKAGAARIRLNTNGQGDLINGKPIAPLLKGLVDAVSVSLNAQDPGTYQKLCRSRFGENAYEAVKAFIRDAKNQGLAVTASVVNLPEVDVEACRGIAERDLGVSFRVRG